MTAQADLATGLSSARARGLGGWVFNARLFLVLDTISVALANDCTAPAQIRTAECIRPLCSEGLSCCLGWCMNYGIAEMTRAVKPFLLFKKETKRKEK